MSIEHVSRSGKVYYLHVKPGQAGKPNFYFSTDADSALVDLIPKGFEIYENVGGQVFLRRIQKKLITDQELDLVRAALTDQAEEWLHKTEVKKNMIVVYETERREGLSDAWGLWVNPAREREFRIQNAYYMAVLRFSLADPARRIFAAERYCFRGSVEDWISVDPPAPLPALVKKYIKHLGKESFYDLF